MQQKDPWANCDVHNSTTVGKSAEDGWATWQPQRLQSGTAQALKLQRIPPRQRTGVSPDMGDETYTSFVEQPSGSHTKRLGGGESAVNMKGDWRSLPCENYQGLYVIFPGNPFKMLPHEYVQKRWPSNRVLIDAARHWRRYGYSATLPNDIYLSADTCGCKSELDSVRAVFKDAWQANAKEWKDSC